MNKFLYFLIGTFLFVTPAHASPYQVKLTEKGTKKAIATFLQNGEIDNLPNSVKLRSSIPRCNRAFITLNRAFDPKISATITTKEGVYDDPVKSLFFNGFMRCGSNPKAYPVAGTFSSLPQLNVFSLSFKFNRDESEPPRRYSLTLKQQRVRETLNARYSSPYRSRLKLFFHDDVAHFPSESELSGFKAESGSIRQLNLAVDADSGFGGEHGQEAGARLTRMFNSISQSYEDQIGLRINLVRQNVWVDNEDPYSVQGSPQDASTVGTLARQFKSYLQANNHLGDADLYHLIYSKHRSQDEVGGYANTIGGSCNPNTNASVTMVFSSAGSAITDWEVVVPMHELGHTLGAVHLPPGSNGGACLMFPGGNEITTNICPASVEAIESHLATVSSCLEEVTGSSPSDPTVNEETLPVDPPEDVEIPLENDPMIEPEAPASNIPPSGGEPVVPLGNEELPTTDPLPDTPANESEPIPVLENPELPGGDELPGLDLPEIDMPDIPGIEIPESPVVEDPSEIADSPLCSDDQEADRFSQILERLENTRRRIEERLERIQSRIDSLFERFQGLLGVTATQYFNNNVARKRRVKRLRRYTVQKARVLVRKQRRMVKRIAKADSRTMQVSNRIKDRINAIRERIDGGEMVESPGNDCGPSEEMIMPEGLDQDIPEMTPPDSMIPVIDEEQMDEESPSTPFIDNEQNQEPDAPSIIAPIPGIELPKGPDGDLPGGIELPEGIEMPDGTGDIPNNPDTNSNEITQECENISSGEGSSSSECSNEIIQGDPQDIPELENLPSGNDEIRLPDINSEIPNLENLPMEENSPDSNINTNSNEQSCESSVTGSGSDTCTNSST